MEEEKKVPELTLEPNVSEAAPAAEASAASIPVLEAAPTLDIAAPAASAEAPAEAPTAGPDMEALTPEEQQAVHDFAEKIDITDSALVLQYGAGAQKNIADFSEAALASVRAKDLGEVGDMITGLIVELKGFDTDEKKGFFAKLFSKAGRRIAELSARYDKVSANVDKISRELEGHQVVLMKDIAILDQMYDKNLEYYKQLTMYILAGRERLERDRATTLVELVAKAEQTGLAEDAQKANDYAAMCDRFEKKLHDLELTRVVSIQLAPQIRLLQNNDSLMIEKIQTSIANTIPLWKTQMLLALGIDHSQSAMEAQHAVTEMTNELLRKNAEKLHTATVATAREAERSIVDVETLRHTNEELITTLDEVIQIQEDGKTKRAAAEAELRKIEGELKQKLLDIRNGKQ